MKCFLKPKFSAFMLLLFVNNNCLVLSLDTLPSGVQVCHKSDPHFNKCMATQMAKALEVWKDGVPELGIPKLEPFEITKLEVLGNKGSISLSQTYENMLTYGIYISEVYDVKINIKDPNDCTWDFWVLTPNAHFEADYKINGKLLVFPIDAYGRCNVTIKNLRNHHRAWCERYQKNGETHLRFTKYSIDMNTDNVHFDYESIVMGNRQLSDQILNSINENSKQIFDDMKHGFETVWNALHLQTGNNFMAKLAENVIFPE